MVDHLLGGTLWNLLVSTVEFVILEPKDYRVWQTLRAVSCYTRRNSKKLEVCRIYINFRWDWRPPGVWRSCWMKQPFKPMANQVLETALWNVFVAAAQFVSFTTQGPSVTAAFFFCSIQQDPLRMSSNFVRFWTQ